MERRCQLGILTRPDGSALYSEGRTTVIAGIYGPVEMKINKALSDKAGVEIHYRPKSGLPGVQDRLYESIIRQSCEAAFAVSLYPRSTIVLVLQEVQNGGEILSSSINAACLAALNSGLEMKCMFAAVTCTLNNDKNLILRAPESRGDIKASFMFVFNSLDKFIISTHMEGSFTTSEYSQALNLCRSETDKIFQFYKSSLSL